MEYFIHSLFWLTLAFLWLPFEIVYTPVLSSRSFGTSAKRGKEENSYYHTLSRFLSLLTVSLYVGRTRACMRIFAVCLFSSLLVLNIFFSLFVGSYADSVEIERRSQSRR